MIDFYEEHQNHRDKFEIIAFHDASAKDFAELDKRLPSLREKYWRGRKLPFPILLDSTGQTIKAYDIHVFPTTLLIDPEGKLVGHSSEEELEKKLPAIPVALRATRALDRGVNLAFAENSLEESVGFLSRVSHIDIRLDEPALKAVRIPAKTPIPLSVTALLSLRSWLELILDPLDLSYEQDDKGLLVTTRKPGAAIRQPSDFQRACAKRIESVLDRKISFQFHNTTLTELTEFLEAKTQESFVLDPAARRAKRLDPLSAVTGSATDIPLREALAKLLDPVALAFTVRYEAVLIYPKDRTALKK